MEPRITDRRALGNPIQALLALTPFIEKSSIDKHLFELVKLRASQINGCTLCMAMHTEELLKLGERLDRISVLPGWRDSGWFDDREQAALAWTEAVTTLEHAEVPDSVYERARTQFSEAELADLTLGIIVINGWNRLNVAFRNPPTPFTIEEANRAVAV
jgi:AhpD family alkylhydroperoxidase